MRSSAQPHPYHSRLFLGVDGGATRTIAIVVDEDGRCVARASGGPTNPFAAGRTAASRNLRQVVERAIRVAGTDRKQCAAAFFGIAGIRKEEDRARFHRTIADRGWAVHWEIDEDARSAWAGALGGSPGLVVLSGTGSKVYGFTPDNRQVSVGGNGYLLGDEGSGAWIGLKALQAVCRAADGRMPGTQLTDLFQEHLQANSPDDILNWIYAEKRSSRDFAALCPIVSRAAQDGDEAAVSTFEAAARQLAELTVHARKSFDRKESVLVSYSGGVFAAGPIILNPLCRELERLAAGIVFVDPMMPPEVGAAKLAAGLVEIP